MNEMQQEPRKKRPLWVILILCLAALAVAAGLYLKNKPEDDPFTILILGDSQMAGFGWDGGYESLILETYPNARVINLAQNGSLLANGNIHAQWEYYLSEAPFLPDVVLLDGGINDLPYLKREEFRDTGLTLVQEGLCSLLEYIHEASPDTAIIYVLMPPFAEWEDSEEGPPDYDSQEAYWKELDRTAGAYDYVTVVDLFSLNPFEYPDAESYRSHLFDSIHLNEAGYRKTYPYIENILTDHLNNAG